MAEERAALGNGYDWCLKCSGIVWGDGHCQRCTKREDHYPPAQDSDMGPLTRRKLRELAGKTNDEDIELQDQLKRMQDFVTDEERRAQADAAMVAQALAVKYEQRVKYVRDEDRGDKIMQRLDQALGQRGYEGETRRRMYEDLQRLAVLEPSLGFMQAITTILSEQRVTAYSLQMLERQGIDVTPQARNSMKWSNDE